jgi:predicted  nucleic acid-binding Zn-ribbon protein
MAAKKQTVVENLSVEDKLKLLFKLQVIDSELDNIKIFRGELPLEVEDIEDEITGLNTREEKFKAEIKDNEEELVVQKNNIKESEALLAKYKEQLDNVRNNREYDSLTKEIEYQELEVELANKKITTAQIRIKELKEEIEKVQELLKQRTEDLALKKKELESIEKETAKEEADLLKKAEKVSAQIEPRLLQAYKRIRMNVRNGVSIARVRRDACGGCFNKIPPQRQVDIFSHRKIIVCEHCGRVLIDKPLAYNVYEDLGGKFKEMMLEEIKEEERVAKEKPKKGRRVKKAK